MKTLKHLHLLGALLLCFSISACKKYSADGPGQNEVTLAQLQGKWEAKQQSVFTNKQPSGATEYFGANQQLFEFNGDRLNTYSGTDPNALSQQYTCKMANGELILRKLYAASASVYTVALEGNNQFSLTETYRSGQNEISIVILFSRK